MEENLYIKSYKKSFEHSYAFGATVVFNLLLSKPRQARLVYVHSSFTENESCGKLYDLCKKLNVPVTVSDKLIARLSPKENVFVIGVFDKFDCVLSDSPVHVVLDNPSNSGNAGTIIRTMLGFGVRDLAIIRPGLDVFDPKTVRASMGAVFDVNIVYYDSIDDYTAQFDRPLYPFMLGGEKYLDEIEIPTGKCALVFGNEATGLPERYVSLGTPVKIRSTDRVDSFNLSIAAAVGLYEFTKGRVL